MTGNILAILACVPLYVVNSFCDKIVSAKNGNRFNCIYNCIKFFLCSLFAVPMIFFGAEPSLALGSILCGASCGVMYVISKTVMLKGYETTSVAFMTLCHSSGMILPCILGHFLWSEKLSLLSVCGILITILAIVLLKGKGSEQNSFALRGIFYGFIIFLMSAGVMITQKMMGLYYSDQSIGLYNFYSFIVAALILTVFSKPSLLLQESKKEKCNILLCALGSAFSLCIIGFVMTNLASGVPSVILFPLFNGLGIILVCIGSVFAFKEKLDTRKILGLIAGVAGLYMINL